MLLPLLPSPSHKEQSGGGGRNPTEVIFSEKPRQQKNPQKYVHVAKRNRKEQILGEKPRVRTGSEEVLQMRAGEAELQNVTLKYPPAEDDDCTPRRGPGAALRRNRGGALLGAVASGG